MSDLEDKKEFKVLEDAFRKLPFNTYLSHWGSNFININNENFENGYLLNITDEINKIFNDKFKHLKRTEENEKLFIKTMNNLITLHGFEDVKIIKEETLEKNNYYFYIKRFKEEEQEE